VGALPTSVFVASLWLRGKRDPRAVPLPQAARENA
jgi:hypothetical protein